MNRRLVIPLFVATISLGGAVFPAAAATEQAWQPGIEPGAPPPVVTASNSWWTGFDEAALDTLQTCAQAPREGASTAAPADVAAAYVGLRIHSLRLRNALALREAAQDARDLLAAQPPRRDAAQPLAELDRRIAGATSSAEGFAQLRDHFADVLAQMTAGAPGDAAFALRDAVADTRWPGFHQPVPQRLPAVVLLTRADVAAAGVRGGLSGWIGPAADLPPIELPGDELSVEQTVRQAGQDVASSLRQLVDAGRNATADLQRVQARQLEVQAAQRLQAAGDASQADVLEAVQQLLAATDRLAAGQGVLALAWIRLNADVPGWWRTAETAH